MTTTVIRYGDAKRLEDNGTVTIIPCWVVGNKATEKCIEEILDDFIGYGYEIKYGSETHYVLFKDE